MLDLFFDNVFRHGDRKRKKIALTFDDGPHPKHTPEILELLASFDVKATFFLTGTNAREHQDLSKKIAQEGHEIGAHSFWHRRMLFLSRDVVESEIDFAFEVIGRITGREIKLFRPPFGVYGYLLPKILKRKGARLILWDVNSRDWKLRDSKRMSAKVISKTRGGSILLFHDRKWDEEDSDRCHTVSALREIIPALTERGFSAVTVSELLGGDSH
jgi:peptidoglycan/xylan/chitin deacetylase (PgdA/CDA1 family)